MDDTFTVSRIMQVVYEQMRKMEYLTLCKSRQGLRLARSEGLQYQISAMFICHDITIHYHHWEKIIFGKDDTYPTSLVTISAPSISKAVLLCNDNDLYASANKYHWSKEKYIRESINFN